LVFLLFRRCFDGLLPLAASLAWLSLPIHSEVVAWISGRGLSLATFFVLLSLLAALKYSERRSAKYLIVVSLACCAALLSHEAGCVAPILATLAVLSTSPAGARWRSTLQTVVAGAIPLAAYGVLRALMFHADSVRIQSLPEILLQGPVSLAKYVWWTVFA